MNESNEIQIFGQEGESQTHQSPNSISNLPLLPAPNTKRHPLPEDRHRISVQITELQLLINPSEEQRIKDLGV